MAPTELTLAIDLALSNLTCEEEGAKFDEIDKLYPFLFERFIQFHDAHFHDRDVHTRGYHWLLMRATVELTWKIAVWREAIWLKRRKEILG